jgi:diaminohydroxyphosphoribosylaminopyrimidine deaminase/5-amino-6-(5-phosphoribosylamino)uracil reductase
MAPEIYMHRCLELAKLAQGNTAPNPMVGSVLVHENKIIGEGYHQLYGEAHAEVNCIRSVKPEHQELIAQSTLYVSLEPCAHFGKTPPCADLIIKNRIPKVVVGCRDPFVQVNGKGIEKLQAAGIQVDVGILEKECKELNKRFFTFHTQYRPYINLKWAQTQDGKIANEDYSRVFISNEYTNRIVHKWRSEEMAILVGTNTALFDDPQLNTRLWPGNDPVRLVVDMNLRLPKSLKLFNGSVPTIVFNRHQHTLPFEKTSVADLKKTGVGYYHVTEEVSLVHQILNALYPFNIQSVLAEGGTYLLQSFIDEGIWDEANIITNQRLAIGKGLPAPVLKDFYVRGSEQFDNDIIHTYCHLHHP